MKCDFNLVRYLVKKLNSYVDNNNTLNNLTGLATFVQGFSNFEYLIENTKTVDLPVVVSIGVFAVTCSAFSDEISSGALKVVDSLGVSGGAAKLDDSVTSSAVGVLDSPLPDKSSAAGAASVGSLPCNVDKLDCSFCCCSVAASLATGASMVVAASTLTLAGVTIGSGSAAGVAVNGTPVNTDVNDSPDWVQDGNAVVTAGLKLWPNVAVLNAGKALKLWPKVAAFTGKGLAVVGANLAGDGVELKKGCINEKTKIS